MIWPEGLIFFYAFFDFEYFSKENYQNINISIMFVEFYSEKCFENQKVFEN